MSSGFVARSEHYTLRRRALRVALSCLLALTGTPAASAPPGARGDPDPDLAPRNLREPIAQITMGILRAQAHLLDLQETVGEPGVTLPTMQRPDARPGSSASVDDVLAAVEHEVGALERILDSGRGPSSGSGLAIADGWSNAALLRDPGDRALFRDEADHRAALFRLADALRGQGLWAGALPYYERLMTPPMPEAAVALTGAMECRFRLGEFREVVQLLGRTRRDWSDPGASRTTPPIPPEATYLAGTAAFRRTDLQPKVRDREALEILRAVEPPFDVPAAYYRGALLVRSGDQDAAIQEFEACERLSAKGPRHQAQQEMCRLALARIDGARWPWDAERYWYGKVPPESPRFQEALYEQAWYHQQAGSEKLALGLVERIVGEDPESLTAQRTALLRAEILSRAGRYSESVEAFGRIRRQSSTMRDQLDEVLRAERGPAAYLEWFTDGPGHVVPPPRMPPSAIRRARASVEVTQALDLWSVLETATRALARARASSDRLDAMVSRGVGRSTPGLPGPDVSWAGALADLAEGLDARVAAEEAKIPGGASSPDGLAGPRKDRLQAARTLRLRLGHLRARARRDERKLVELRGSRDGQPPAEIVEEQRTLADADRELGRLRTEAQEILGLQVYRALLDVRTQLDRTVLQADRGVVEVALARTKDAERRVESLVFRRKVEESLPWREDRPEALATLESRSRDAEAEDRRVREEAIAQLNDYVLLHEDDPVYTPQALSRLTELQVGSQGPASGRPSAGSRVADTGPGVGSKGCATVVELHRRLAKGFPDYRQKDAVYFLAAYCLGEAGKASEARQTYSDLVRKYPESPHVPEAWVRIGDLDFEEGRPDSLARAADAYAKAAARNDHALNQHAAYMLGWTQYRLDDLPRAVETLRTLLDHQLPAPREAREDLPVGAVNLLGSMLADPRWDGVAKARVLFAKGGKHPYEVVVYRRLADELFEQGRYVQAVEAYKLAIARAPLAADAPRLQERIVLSWSREGRSKEEALERERLVATYDESSEWSQRNQGAGARPVEVREMVETSRAQTAAALHAQARDLARAGKQQAAVAEYRRAAQVYARVLQTAPGVKGAEGMALARAECTFGAGEYEAAAHLFEAARDASADPRYRVEAAREAVRSWEEETARQQEAGLLEGRDLPLPGVLRSLVSSADALVARFPDDANSPAAAFQAGETFYRYQDWAEARRRLEEVAARWPGSEVANKASRLVVESHLASRDWSAGEAAASRLRQQASPRDAALAAELRGLELASRFQRATELLNEKKWSDAAAIFQAIADEAPRHPLADKALYNAAICQENDRHFQAASSLFGRIVAEHPDSPYAPESLFRQAFLAEAAFDFAKAAERYEVLIERYPDSKQMRDALYNRALSLEILQRYEEAGLAFERHASLIPAAGDAPATLLRAAEVLEKGAAWPRVVRTLQEFQRRYSKAGDPELLVVAHLRAGRAESELGHEAAARAAYAKAVAEFARRGLEPGANPAGAAAAAEAQFRLAERELQRFDRSVLPATSQAGALEKALKAQLSEMSKLSSRYEEVKRFQSPDWTVAALYRQGYLSERFARALHEAPVPPEFKRAGQEPYLAAYQAQLATFAQPYDAQAVEAYTRSIRLAQERRVESEWARRAGAALAQLRPGEFANLRRAKGRFLPESPPQLDEEELAARKALAKDDRDVTAMVKLAIVSLARKRIELASAILASAHKVAPDEATVWNALGLVDLALGARAQAQARWKKAVEMNPDCADAQANYGQLLVEAGDFQGAVVALERAVRIAPGSAPAWLGLGSAYRGLGRVDDAQRAGGRALALDVGKTPATGGVQ